MNEKVAAAQQEIRARLLPLLKEGEELLACTSGYLLGRASQRYEIGLTSERVILLHARKVSNGSEPKAKVYSLLLSSIISATPATSEASPALKFRLLAGDDLEFWYPMGLGKEIADLVNRDCHHEALLNAQIMLDQASVFKALDCLASAGLALSKALELDPTLSTHPEISMLEEHFSSELLALRAAACFILFGTAIASIAALASMATFSLKVVLAVFTADVASIKLVQPWWRGQRRHRFDAILPAAIPMAVFTAIMVRYGDILPFVVAILVDGALILLLVGRSSHAKTMVAIGMYTVGTLAFFVQVFF